MEYLNNSFGLLFALGVLALIIAAIVYFRQKKKTPNWADSTIVEADTEVVTNANKLPNLSADSLMAYLSPLRNDQPVLIHAITGLLENFKTEINIKVLRTVLEHLDVSNDVLSKINKHKELVFEAQDKPRDFERRNNITELTHERDRERLVKEIKDSRNPSPPSPTPSPPKPPKTKAQRLAEEKKRREKEAPRQEAEVRKWRKELSEDPYFNDEDIETEIERRKRSRGWLDTI